MKKKFPPASPKSGLPHEEAIDKDDASYYTFNNPEQYRSFVTEFKSSEYYNENDKKTQENNSFHSFEQAEYNYETAHPYLEFETKGYPDFDGKSVLFILKKDVIPSESSNFCYENGKLYKKPKAGKPEEKGKFRVCFCFRKAEPHGTIIHDIKCRNGKGKERMDSQPDEQKAQNINLHVQQTKEDDKGCLLI